MLYAQLTLRSRRTQETTFATATTAISASATEKAAISSQTLTGKIDSSESIACDLSNFHVLGVYPETVYAYNEISASWRNGSIYDVLEPRKGKCLHLWIQLRQALCESHWSPQWRILRTLGETAIRKKNNMECSEQS
jgi:hypothetical protein